MKSPPLWVLDQTRARSEQGIDVSVKALREDLKQHDATRLWAHLTFLMVEDDPVRVAAGLAAALLVLARSAPSECSVDGL